MYIVYIPLVVLAPPEYHPAVRQVSLGCVLHWMLAAGSGNFDWSEFEHGKYSEIREQSTITSCDCSELCSKGVVSEGSFPLGLGYRAE